MSYYIYLDKLLLPVTPEKLKLKVKNANKTMQLINSGEINLLKAPGLTEIQFDALLPNVRYPYATYKDGFKKASYFLQGLEQLKVNKKAFQFIVSRSKPNGEVLYDTNMKVSLEEYTISEEASLGFDNKVTIKLKQYKDFATKIIKIAIKQENNQTKTVAMQQTQREAVNAPTAKTYTVVKGDSLWKISKKYYNNGAQYTKIYNANKDKIKNPNLIYPGQVLTIP